MVELGEEITIASTILPPRNLRLFFSRCLFTSLNSAFPETVMFRPIPEVEDGRLAQQTVQRQAGELAHGLNFVRGIFHSGVTAVI